jgi:8-oxo-dGTP pyrophosphatase MutT (NUDIX family)
MTESQIIQIANVAIVNGNKVLLVQQRKPIAYGLWSLPGGHIEESETPEVAAIREVHEEVGAELLDIKPLKIYPINNSLGTFHINTFIGRLNGDVTLKDDELLAYGWFSLESLETMIDKLRDPQVLDQVRDALAGNR